MSRTPVHGDAIGKTKRLYNIWRGIRQRCGNPKATGYCDYGGRGIQVNSEWDHYIYFRDWALANGYAEHLTIERSNVNDHYSSTNCIWADNTTQACNKRKRPKAINKYIGVGRNRELWKAYLNYKGKYYHLGSYKTELEAVHVRDAYVKANNLPHKLNF